MIVQRLRLRPMAPSGQRRGGGGEHRALLRESGVVRIALAFALLFGCLGCTRQRSLPDEAADVQVSLETSPSPPVVGDGSLELAFQDADGEPTRVVNLRLKADMTHPGMTPWLAEVKTPQASRVTIPVSWSMAGDWVIRVEAELTDGRHLRRLLPIRIELAGEDGSS